jgi:hypothetical protein
MKALVLDGDDVREAVEFAEVAAAHTAGKTFWIELEKSSAIQREASSRGGASLQQRVPVSPPL